MKTSVVVTHNIRSVENAGSILRTAECLGVSKVYFCGTTPTPVDRFGRPRSDFTKVSLGAENLVEWEYRQSIEKVLKELKDQGFLIIALEQDARAENIAGVQSPNQFALIVGNEVDGVSEEVLTHADKIVEIEMKGEKESLNVSVATGIALFELLK